MDSHSIRRREIERIYGKISPFELKNKLISLAIGQFAAEETRRVWNEHDLAGMSEKEGIAERFNAYVEKHPDTPGIELLKKIIHCRVTDLGFAPDDWVHELADGISC